MKGRFQLYLAASLIALTSVAPAVDLLDKLYPEKFGNERLLREAEDTTLYTNLVKEIEIAKTYPKTWSGTVYLDGKPAEGIRVTDGIGFVSTGKDGRYTITIQPDAMQPYLPNRNLSVCWPDNTFPAKDEKTGDLLWWRCVADFKDKPDQVDFHLVTRKYTRPLVIAFGTDPHEGLFGAFNRIWGEEIKQGGGRVDFAILGGDLTYASFDGADEHFGHMRQFTREFPLPLLHVQGNHDFTGPFFVPHPNSGFGPFARYLGPIRWSFDAGGVHIASMNYWLANTDSVRWLEEDLKAARDMPTYLFVHSWGPFTDEICQKFPNVRLVLAGHSHKTAPAGWAGNAEFWSYYLYYRLVYIEGEYFDFVDRDVSVNPLYRYSRQDWGPGGQQSTVSNKTVRSSAVALKCFPNSDQYDIEFVVPAKEASAKRWGLRVTNEAGKTASFHYDKETKALHMAGRETFLVLEPLGLYAESKIPPIVGDDGVLKFRINIHTDHIQCTVNDRISHVRYVKVGKPRNIEIFAEDGEATFRVASVWEQGSPPVKWPVGANVYYGRDPVALGEPLSGPAPLKKP